MLPLVRYVVCPITPADSAFHASYFNGLAAVEKFSISEFFLPLFSHRAEELNSEKWRS